MQLNDLIIRTHADLTARKKRMPVTEPSIEQVLEGAGISAFLTEGSDMAGAPRLIIRRVQFRGQKWQQDGILMPFEYDRRLNSGVNVWVAGNSRGKSTVLKVIVWALTGVKPTMKQDIEKWLTEVAVEIEISNEGIYTIQYFLTSSKSDISGRILQMSIDDINVLPAENLSLNSKVDFSGRRAMKDKIGEFFSVRFGFHDIDWVEAKRYKIDLTTKTVSWDVYSQVMFLGADDYSDYMFPDYRNKSNRQSTLSNYLGMDLVKAVAELKRQFRESDQEFQLEKRRIQTNAKGIQDRIDQLQSELEDVEARIRSIDAGRAAVVDTSYAQSVNEKVSRLTKQKADTALALEALKTDERRLRQEINLTRRQAREMKEAIQFKLYLSGLEVERCPLCETGIPITPIESHLDESSCRVCHNPLKPVTDTSEQERILRNAEGKTRELNRQLRNTRRSIKQMEDALAKTSDELEQFSQEFQSLAEQQRQGFSAEFSRLLNRRGYLAGQLQELRQLAPSSQADYLQQLEHQRDILQCARNVLEIEMNSRAENSLGFLEERVSELARQFRVRNVQSVFLNNNYELFVRQSDSSIRFPALDTGEKLRLKLAFHLALLALRIEEGVGRHPGVLIIDAPGGAEMTDATFDAILSGISDLAGRVGNQVQILIASTRDELADPFPLENVERMPEGKALF